jgi:hypothetical protein
MYYSEVLETYDMDDGTNGGAPGYCDQNGAIALTSPTGPTMTLCPNGFFQRPASATLDTSQPEGTFLQNLEPFSLTLIHELFHVIDNTYPDLAAFAVPEDTPVIDPTTQSPNPNWPGDPTKFVQQNFQAGKQFSVINLIPE